MSKADRFSKLETSPSLPQDVQAAISRLPRFESLEITTSLSPKAVKGGVARILCAHCNQSNEKNRELCWACHKSLATLPTAEGVRPAIDQPIDFILDGVSYRSTDAELPDDIRELMDRIRKEGYSKQLLANWQKWRSKREDNVPAPAYKKVEVFQGQRISVLRIDGVLYKSDDTNLPSAVQEIFEFIAAEGLSPALMQHLRLYGTLVKYRPPSTPLPSDGDLNFWEATKRAFRDRP